MACIFARLFLLSVMLWCAAPGWTAQPNAPDGTIVLGDHNPSFQINTNTLTWLTAADQADIQSVAAAPERFQTTPALTRHSLNETSRLWVRLRLQRDNANKDDWTLNIPLPTVDSVTLYQRDGQGNWASQNSGDHLPQKQWSKRGLYPEFSLFLPAGTTQDVYLKVHNFKHLSLPIRISTMQYRDTQRSLESTMLGLVMGALTTLMFLSLLRYFEHHDHSDGFAALYGLMVTLGVAQLNGVLNAHAWSDLPAVGDFANSVFPVVVVGCALLFVRHLYQLSTRYYRYHRLLATTGWATMASALCYGFLDRGVADVVCSLFLFFATFIGMVATLLSWRGGSPIGPWLVAAYAPQFLGVIRLIAESAGLIPTFWEARYLTSLSVAVSVPILVYALGRVTQDRKKLEERANQLPTQDALTGLLNREQFQAQLSSAFERVIGSQEPVALVLVKLANYDAIVKSFGEAIGEQCLLRGVVKLQRILRDVDPAGRTSTASFALLLEGVASRERLTERMVKLVGSGLIPVPGLVPEVTLDFQAACVLLQENPLPPDTALAELEALLATFTRRTRRPIRFLEPPRTAPMGLYSSELPSSGGAQL
jgi:diguanylate cyclase (GGDEF)-like protein